MADHPDWTDNNVISAQSQLLWFDSAPIVNPIPLVLDVSLFASLDLYVRLSGVAGANPSQVKVIWSIAGQSVAVDSFTVWPQLASEAINAPYFTLPVKGDQVTIANVDTPAGTGFARTVVGSTRSVNQLQISGGPGIDPGIQTGGLGIAIGTGANKNYYLGPLQGPFDFAFIAVTGAMVVTILAYYYDASDTLRVVLIKQTAVPAGTSLNYQGINLPRVAFTVGITNNSGAPGAYDVTVSGGT